MRQIRVAVIRSSRDSGQVGGVDDPVVALQDTSGEGDIPLPCEPEAQGPADTVRRAVRRRERPRLDRGRDAPYRREQDADHRPCTGSSETRAPVAEWSAAAHAALTRLLAVRPVDFDLVGNSWNGRMGRTRHLLGHRHSSCPFQSVMPAHGPLEMILPNHSDGSWLSLVIQPWCSRIDAIVMSTSWINRATTPRA